MPIYRTCLPSPSPSLGGRIPPSFRGKASPAEALITAAVLAALAASVPAQRQFDELGKRGLPADRDRTLAVALGDVDGDGDLDMVLGNSAYRSGQRQNRLYLNDGAGTYTDVTATRMPPDSDMTRAVALGDVDGDGDLDVVFGNRGQNRLYLNDGSGTFTDATAARLPADSRDTLAVALGDVDGDGDLDIVFGNYGDGSKLYLNAGAGAFADVTAARLPAAIGYSCAAVALGDVDGDFDLDIVLGNFDYLRDDGSSQNRLFLNDGTGTFIDATASRLPADRDKSLAVALGDVDGDHDLDIVFGNYYINPERIKLYLNDGTGTFSNATSGRLPAGADTHAVALGDVDGDLDLDLVVGNGGYFDPQQNRLYVNDGTGTFADATVGRLPAYEDDTRAVVLGDVDGDLDLDLVLANVYSQQSLLYLNDSSGSFVDATAARLPIDRDFTLGLALGDVDGDGDLDLVTGNNSFFFRPQQNRLYLNDGTGAYTDATAARMPVDDEPTMAVALGDVDDDGDLDMIFGSDGGPNQLYLNDGAGTFTDVTSMRMPGGGSSSVALGDVDGDGDLDIVFGNRGQTRLHLNDGAGTFTDVTASRMPARNDDTLAVALGDADGDGDLDIVSGNRGQNRLHLNDGAGTFTDITGARMPVDSDWTQAVAWGDADGDGDLDILFGNRGQDRLYLNDGAGSFTDVTASHMPADDDDTRAVALGDVDGDGDLDATFGDRGQNRLYLNDGAGVFSDATAARLPAADDETRAVALGDVDGDGDLDLISGNDRSQLNRLYVNLLRQLDAPLPLRVGRTYTFGVYARHGAPSRLDMAWAFVSMDPASIPLPPLRGRGIGGARAMRLRPLLIRQPGGVGSVSYTVPNDPALLGMTLYSQAILARHPLQRFLTNVTTDVFGQ